MKVTNNDLSHPLYFLYGHDDSGGRVSLAWFVGTSSDFIPPTTLLRAQQAG